MSGIPPVPDDIRSAIDAETKLLDHILIAAGGSEPSLSALRLGLHLAPKTSRVEVVLVEDVHLPPGAFLARGEILARLMREAENLASYGWDQAAAGIKRIAEQQGRAITIQRERGRVADVIVAASARASMIVLGKQGCRTEHGGLLGSNAELIVRRSWKPVLLAPDAYRPPRRIVVAYGGKDMGVLALGMGLVLANRLSLPLSVLTVEHDGQRHDSIWERVRGLLPDLADRASFERDTGDVASAIVRRATPETLVVMGAYGRSRLYRLVLGSVSVEVMRTAGGPVLLSRK